MADFSYKIHDDFDKVFDEKGNTFLALRKITWGEGTEPKLDLRKWYIGKEGQETVGKGFSFLTEDGPNELVNVLTESGYGITEEILQNIKDRKDFFPALVNTIGKESLQAANIDVDEVDEDDDLYDPRAALFEVS